ncbi:DNA cytosine methyltransferase [Candidatus Gracilibacteria bacterium]|nr:DNA cytosine methyltransferase [Candidatus Gracilibacteria bacterium]
MLRSSFRFVDLFAGIGGFRLALEALGGMCVASSEIDTQAIEVYRSNWPGDSYHHNVGDIKAVTTLPTHDLIVGGVPCQPWSIAGQNKAFSDPRGELWADVIRVIEINRPRAFIFENVKGLVDPRHKDCLDLITSSFRALGYTVYTKLLNSFDYGVPQNRDRVFLIGVRNDVPSMVYQFPTIKESQLRLYEIFDELAKPEVSIPEIIIQRDLFGERIGVGFNKLTPRGQFNEFFVLNDIRHGPTSIHSWEVWDTTEREKVICMLILRNRRNKRYGPDDGNPMHWRDIQALLPDIQRIELDQLVAKKILRTYEDEKYEFVNRRLSGGIDGTYRIFLPTARFFGTLTARGMKDAVAEIPVSGNTAEEYKMNFIREILLPKRYRPITVREAARLQMFPESYRLHSNATVNFRLFGNSVAVPVVMAVAQSLLETGALTPQSQLRLAI